MSGQTDRSMLCIVCGIRSPADGSVCAPCRDILKSAVTGTVVPASADPAPQYDKVDALSESPTSPHLQTPPGPSGRLEDVGRRYGAGDQLDGRYTIVEEIGVGGMGVVYKALDRNLEKTVALKLMRARAMDAPNVARFRRELALAQHVSHANVCRVHDLGEVDGVLYISMEHVEGQRLDHVIVSMGRLSPRQTVALGRQLCAGLRAIHEQGIIHRDLKPSNVMVNRSGHVFIMDFGLAIKPGRDKVTSTGAVLGTFAYLSPEQARGLEIGPRSDVYAAGLILYEMLTGVAPPGDEVALPLALRDARERCPPPSELAADTPPELDAIVMRCLERDPSRRFATAEELESALGRVQAMAAHSTGRVPPSGTTARLWKLVREGRHRSWAAAAFLLLAVAAIGGLYRWRHPASNDAERPIVAVLPLTNLSLDQSFSELGIGLADVLVTHLASSAQITVISGPSAARDAKGQDVRGIARELGASHVLSGSLQATGGRVRVALTLLRARDSVIVGVEEGDTTINDIFDLPARMAEKVSATLHVELSEDERRRLSRPPTESIEAFADYSRAKALMQERDMPGKLDQAIQLLDSAVRKDPRFALAHAALGDACGTRFRETKDVAWANRASSSIMQALALDSDQPMVRLSLAQVLHLSGHRGEAVGELRRILARQPDNDEAHRLLGSVLADEGETDSAVAEMRKAIALRAGYWQYHVALGNVLFQAGRHRDAADEYREVIRLRPESDRGYYLLGAAHLAMSEPRPALENFERALRIAPSATTFANIAIVREGEGNLEAAAEGYRRAIELKPNEPIFYINLADAERRLGSKGARATYERALELLERLLSVNAKDAPKTSLLAICELELDRRGAAVKHADAAVALAPRNYEVLHRAAGVHAGVGHHERALALLREAFGAGYSIELAQRSEAFEPLRKLPAFQALITEVRANRKRAAQ